MEARRGRDEPAARGPIAEHYTSFWSRGQPDYGRVHGARGEGLLQGDLFYYAEGSAFPPSGRETMNRFFAGFLRDKGLAPLAIYGVHNDGAVPPELLVDAVR